MANPAPGFTQHPDYQVNITPIDSELVVKAADCVVARSTRAVIVEETRHRPVWYMPMEDIDARYIEATATDTYCPFKGHASYWSVITPEQTIEDAIWAYLAPYDECTSIRSYASFYTNKLDLYINGKLVNSDGPGWVD